MARFKPALMVSALCSTLLGCQSGQPSLNIGLLSNTQDFRPQFYSGASFGQSRLNPQTTGTDLRVESTSDVGTQLRLGYDLHNRLALEFDTAMLGSSALGHANTGVEYSAATVSALIYGLSGVQMRSRREGLSSYVRLGYGMLSKVSILEDFDFKGGAPVLGLGVEYGLDNGVGVRTEIIRFDSDVSYIGIGAIFRFGKSTIEPRTTNVAEGTESVQTQAVGRQYTSVQPKGMQPNVEQSLEVRTMEMQPKAEQPVELQPSEVLLTSAANSAVDQNEQGLLADRWRPEKRNNDGDSDGVVDAQDVCQTTPRYVTVGSDGCGLFDQRLEDVTFAKGSRELRAAARHQLDSVAQTLLAFPESRIQIRVHTDSRGSARRNLALSSHRATVVSEYLQSQGVAENQLLAIGLGETQPIGGNVETNWKSENRRVELLTLPDLDAGHLVNEARLVTPIVKNISPAKNSTMNPTREGGGPRVNIASTKPKPDSVSAKREPKILSAKVVPMPVPGYAPGAGIAGIVQGLDFEPGSDVLTGSGEAALQLVIQSLKAKPTIAIAFMVHSAELDNELDNENLTDLQASAIVEFLVANGVEPERLQAEGHGELLPLVQNLSDEDRARNRRVEIRILPDWPEPSSQ